jgi:hypothetical protein
MIGIREFAVLFSNVERNAGGSAIQPIFRDGLCANLSYEVANPVHKRQLLPDIRQGGRGRSKFSFFDHEHEQEPLIPFGPKTTSLASSPKGY